MMKLLLAWAAVMTAFVSLVSAQQPVDTHQFGLIQHGMTEAEVLQRLGPPAKITRSAYITEAGTVEMGLQYHYPGSGRILPTVIIFAGGRVVKKEKGASKLWQQPR